jgi:hypothetical protein
MADLDQLATLRTRAQDWRRQAERERSPREASRLLQLAEALEQEADAIGRFRAALAARPRIPEPSHWRALEIAVSAAS